MSNFKKWIDYLFWKRMWFRIIFIILPIWVFPLGMLMYKCGVDMSNNGEGKPLLILMVIIAWVLGIVDNENVDSPPKPY